MLKKKIYLIKLSYKMFFKVFKSETLGCKNPFIKIYLKNN